MKALDGDRDFADVRRQRRLGRIAQSLESRHRKEWPPAFARALEPFAGNLLRFAADRPHDFCQRLRGKPRIDFIPQRSQIEPAGLVIAGQMDVIPDPVEIDGRVDAIILQQRNRHAGNRRCFHVGKRALENTEAAHTDNRLDLPGLDQRHDNRRALRDEHGIAEPLGFSLQVLDRAKPALLAKQPELVEWRGAFAFHAQAFWKKQQPAAARHGGEGLAPHLVIDQDADVVAIDRITAEKGNHRVGVPL